MNRFPEVREFIKGEGNADSYDKLTVKYISGHNPDLVIFADDGTETERINMTPFSTAELHELVREKGFQKVEVEL